MIGAARQWARRMFAPRYWPKVGATAAPVAVGRTFTAPTRSPSLTATARSLTFTARVQ